MGQGKAQQAVFVVFKTDSKIEVVQELQQLVATSCAGRGATWFLVAVKASSRLARKVATPPSLPKP